MSAPEWLTEGWGTEVAQQLWDSQLDLQDVPWENARVLDVGCSWGYALRHLLTHAGVREAHGVDVQDVWNTFAGDPAVLDGITFHHGEVDQVAALQDERFDVITCTGTLMLLPSTRQMEVVRWMFEHLQPGGHCIVSARTYLASNGADQQRHVRTPLAHLVFGPREIDALLARREEPPLRYMNPSCGATYLMLFRRAGFDLIAVDRTNNVALEAAREQFATRLSVFDETELRTSEIRAHLRRPETTDLSELRPPG